MFLNKFYSFLLLLCILTSMLYCRFIAFVSVHEYRNYLLTYVPENACGSDHGWKNLRFWQKNGFL